MTKEALIYSLRKSGYDFESLIERSRKQKVVEVRQVCMYLLNETYTLEKTGKFMKRDHATVVHSKKKINDLLSINDKRTINLLNKLRNYNFIDYHCNSNVKYNYNLA